MEINTHIYKPSLNYIWTVCEVNDISPEQIFKIKPCYSFHVFQILQNFDKSVL